MVREIRFAFRRLVRSPGFVVIAVVTLALAIGASTAVLSVTDSGDGIDVLEDRLAEARNRIREEIGPVERRWTSCTTWCPGRTPCSID
jgi:hypothetical protein